MFQITISALEEEMSPAQQYPGEDRGGVAAVGVGREYELLQHTAPIRDGHRLPTPDRRAVIELCDSPEVKHQLRRQQQLLTDIAQRAREQEISALSGALSKKLTLDEFDRKYERPRLEDGGLRKYTTNSSVGSMSVSPSKGSELKLTLAGIGEEDGEDVTPAEALQSIQARPEFARATTFFPKRKLRKQQKQSGKWKSLPRLQIAYSKGLMPSSTLVQHQHMIKTNLIKSRNINGPIQLKHYIQPKDPLAPLILPSIRNAYGGGDSDSGGDTMDAFFQSSAIPMTARSKTVYGGLMVSKPPTIVHTARTVPINKGSSTSRDTGRDTGDGAWVTQSMATLSIAPSTSPTPHTGRAKTVLSRTSVA